MRKFTDYIKEEVETTRSLNSHTDMIQDIRDMIMAMSEDDEEKAKSIISQYKELPDSTIIVGFVNDADIYDFYIKWRDDIDEILSGIEYFSTAPSENNIFSLYLYIIDGTKKAFREIMKVL